MRALPAPDPGVPDLRSPVRFLLRVLRLQAGTLGLGTTYGSVALVAAALVPYALARAVDDGLRPGDDRGLLLWCGVLLGLAVAQAAFGTLRHRTTILSFLRADLRTLQWLAGQVARLGAELPRQVSTGDVGSAVATDCTPIGRGADIHTRGTGTVVSFVLVAGLLLEASPSLGPVVVLGGLVDAVSQGTTRAHVDLVALALVAAVLALTALTGASRLVSLVLAEQVFAELREEFREEVVERPLSTVEAAGSGDLLTRMPADVDVLAETVRDAVPEVLVAVAHRPHTAHDADRVAVVDDGRVTEPGTHEELLAADGDYAALSHAWQSDAAPAR